MKAVFRNTMFLGCLGIYKLLCSFLICVHLVLFLLFSTSVMYLAIFWQRPFFRSLLMTFVICLFASFICSFCCSATLQNFHRVLIIMSANFSLSLNSKQFFHYDQNIVTSVNYYWIFVHSCWLFNTLFIAIFIILCCFSRITKFFLFFFRTFSVVQVTKS